MAKTKYKVATDYKVLLPKTRYQANVDKKISYAAAEVDMKIVEKGVSRLKKDYKIYKNVDVYIPSLSRWRTDTTLSEEGFATLEDAIKRVDELTS